MVSDLMRLQIQRERDRKRGNCKAETQGVVGAYGRAFNPWKVKDDSQE